MNSMHTHDYTNDATNLIAHQIDPAAWEADRRDYNKYQGGEEAQMWIREKLINTTACDLKTEYIGWVDELKTDCTLATNLLLYAIQSTNWNEIAEQIMENKELAN